MDPLIYYTSQSRITNPGQYISLFSGLPDNIADICTIVQGLIIHYGDSEKLYSYTIPENRLSEVDICYVEAMLDKIIQLDNRPLNVARPPEKRIIGCCRDFATLFCAIARHKGIPTRNRVGFGAYFEPGYFIDHEIVEYWDISHSSWRFVDPEISKKHKREYKITFNPHQVPRDKFIVGGHAWSLCRAGKADPDRFGHGPGGDIQGMWFVRHRLIHDLAAMNKMELLLWNVWGLMEKDPTDDEVSLLDNVAKITQEGDGGFKKLRKIYEHEPGLRVPEVVLSFSPASSKEKMRIAI